MIKLTGNTRRLKLPTYSFAFFLISTFCVLTTHAQRLSWDEYQKLLIAFTQSSNKVAADAAMFDTICKRGGLNVSDEKKVTATMFRDFYQKKIGLRVRRFFEYRLDRRLFPTEPLVNPCDISVLLISNFRIFEGADAIPRTASLKIDFLLTRIWDELDDLDRRNPLIEFQLLDEMIVDAGSARLAGKFLVAEGVIWGKVVKTDELAEISSSVDLTKESTLLPPRAVISGKPDEIKNFQLQGRAAQDLKLLVLLSITLVCGEKNDSIRANFYYDQARLIRPAKPDLYAFRADIGTILGDIQGAKTDLEKAVELESDETLKQRYRIKLNNLTKK